MNALCVIIMYKNKVLLCHLGDFLRQAGMTVIDDISSLSELQTKLHQLKPDAIFLEFQHAKDEFPVFLESLKQILPQAKWVLTGPEPESYYAKYAIDMGADLYLSEKQSPNEWLSRLYAMMPYREKP